MTYNGNKSTINAVEARCGIVIFVMMIQILELKKEPIEGEKMLWDIVLFWYINWANGEMKLVVKRLFNLKLWVTGPFFNFFGGRGVVPEAHRISTGNSIWENVSC